MAEKGKGPRLVDIVPEGGIKGGAGALDRVNEVAAAQATIERLDSIAELSGVGLNTKQQRLYNEALKKLGRG